MASAQAHRDWARRNWDFYEASRHAGFRDWSVTIALYVALHEMKAFFEDNRAAITAGGAKVPRTHGQIKFVLRTVNKPDWHGLGALYATLLGRSISTRYKLHEPTPAQVDEAEYLMRAISLEISNL